jgi:light-regulated signal transduction histidine kinase (bacteriophytochrome)
MQNHPSALQEIVNLVMDSLVPFATTRKSFLVNDIAPEIELYADKDMLALVVSDVLKTAIRHTENDCIRITAKSVQDSIFLNVKENGCRPYIAVAESMERIQPLAEKLGGFITVASSSHEGVTVAFSFYNGYKAA